MEELTSKIMAPALLPVWRRILIADMLAWDVAIFARPIA